MAAGSQRGLHLLPVQPTKPGHCGLATVTQGVTICQSFEYLVVHARGAKSCVQHLHEDLVPWLFFGPSGLNGLGVSWCPIFLECGGLVLCGNFQPRCVYEAFLASSWDKKIRLAKRPWPNQWPRILRVLSTGVAAFGADMLYPLAGVKWYGISPDSFSLHWDLEWAFAYVGGTFGAFVALTWKCCFRRATATIQIAIHCMTVFLALSVAMSASWRGLTNVPNLFRLVATAVGSTGLEADWQRAARAWPQADQLAKDFKGTVRDATSSSADDLRRILCEIEEHEQTDAIDNMVASLMATNVSTAQLRSVVKVTGHLKDLSDWSRAIFLLTLLVLIFQFRQLYTYRVGEDGMTIGWLLKACAGEALLWPIIFLSLPVESKALGCFSQDWQGGSFDAFAHLCVIPLFMVLATLGWRVSRVPVLGPALIRMFFLQSLCPG